MNTRLHRLLSSFLLLLPVLFVGTASAASAANTGQPRSTYLITFKDGVNPRAEADALRGQGFNVRFTYENLFPGVAVELPATAVNGISQNPNVALVEPDVMMKISASQSGVTWGLDRSDQRSRPINGTFTYPDSAGQGVRAYIVDTGILAGHTEFTGRMATGYTAIADGRGTTDCNGHGTHVAGTTAGTVYGLAKKATLIPVRVLDCSGSGGTSGIVAALDWIAVNRGSSPAVANMSLGGGANSTLDNAVTKLVNAGVTVVVAAGNSGVDACTASPARTAAAVTVGATDSSDIKASWSNFGTCLDIFAPGVSVTSAWNTSSTATNTISGTSMASPHVAGAAALLLGTNPSWSPTQVRDSLVASATGGVVASAGTGSPNSLLYVEQPAAATAVSITTTSLPNGTQYLAYPSTQLTATGGDGANYSWSATGLPTGLSLSGNTISGTPSVSGTFPVGLTVTSGGQTASTSLSITIAPGTVITTPGAFSKSSPANGSTGVPRFPTLQWAASSNATSYEVCLTTSTTCSSWTNVGNVTQVTTSTRLLSRTTYRWHVRAVNSAGSTLSNGSATPWTFTTAR